MLIFYAIGLVCAYHSFLEVQDKESQMKEYTDVLDGIYAEAYSDRNNYGFYSVTAQQISDDIDALEGIYDLMEDDEIVEINGLDYSKQDVADYIEIDKGLRSNFEDDEVIVIYGGSEGSEIITVDELEQLEEQVKINKQT